MNVVMRSPKTSTEAVTLANELQLRRMRAEAKKKHLEAEVVAATAECVEADLEHHAMIAEYDRLVVIERSATTPAPPMKRSSSQSCECPRCSADRRAAN